MLRFRDVSFEYNVKRKNTGVNHIDCHIRRGECVLLCGLSGCGKSTITRLINGLTPHYYEGRLSGEILLNGKNVAAMPLHEIAMHVGSVFQNPRSQFFNTDTDGELAFACENQGLPMETIRQRVNEAVGRFGLAGLCKKSIFNLSGGEKQRIACASVYAASPDIFVLDEPSSNLDAPAIEKLRQTLTLIKAQGKTIVIAEHRLYYLASLVDRVFYMTNGSIAREYAASEFLGIPQEKRKRMGLRSFCLKELQNEAIRQTHPETSGMYLERYSFRHRGSKKSQPNTLSIPRLNVPGNQVVAVIGDNGAGKTTFVRCLCGLQKHAKGDIQFRGKAMSAKKRLAKSYVVMQDVNHQLFTENVEEELVLEIKHPDTKRLDALLRYFKLDDVKKEHPMSLSGGQKQRVAIAAALMSEKEIIALDEPTSGLDFNQMLRVAETVRSLQKENRMLLVISHDLEFILSCCTYVIHLKTGMVFEQYSLDSVGKQKLLDTLAP